jgi:hypothetical protein
MVLKGQVMKRLIPEEKQWNRLFARWLMLSWLKEMVRFSKCSSSWLRSKNDLFKCALSFSSRSVRICKMTWAIFHLFSRHYHHFKIQRVWFSKIWACPLSVRQDDSVPVFHPWVSKLGESGNRPTWWPHKCSTVFIHHRNNNIDYYRALVIHVDTLFQKRQPVPRRENWLDSNSLTWNALKCEGST